MINEELSRITETVAEDTEYESVFGYYFDEDVIDPVEYSQAIANKFTEINSTDMSLGGYEPGEVETAANVLMGEVQRELENASPVPGSVAESLVRPLIRHYTQMLQSGEYVAYLD